MKRKIKWGIIGPGRIAQDFAEDFRHVDNGEIVAVASRSAERARSFAKSHHIPHVYGSYEELYASSEVDVVYIATPHNFHFEQSKKAILAGKAVMCEKPITTSLEECENLFRLAESSGQYLMEGMWMYFLPAIKKAQEWVREGRIGKVRHVKSDFGFHVPFDPDGRMYNPELAGGALLDMGIYPVAITNLFLGARPKNLDVVSRHATTGVDKDVSIMMDYGEATALLHTSFECRLPNLTHIIGEEGALVIPDCWGAKEVTHMVDGEEKEKFRDQSPGRGFHHEISAVSEDILIGRLESKTVNHETSLQFQRLMHSIKSKFSM